MKPSRQRLGQAALVVAGIAALGAALGSFGALAWWLELFSHFRPQYAIALLASGVVLLGLRQPVAGLAALGVALLNAMPLLHYYGIRSASAGGEAELQVIAVNLFEYNRQHQRMLDYVRTAAPDIVIFSEATPVWREAIDHCLSQPQHYAPKGAWTSALDQVAEGQQHTLGAYHRPWK